MESKLTTRSQEAITAAQRLAVSRGQAALERVVLGDPAAGEPRSTGALVARASRSVFEIGLRGGKMSVPEPPKGPPVATFRDQSSGAIRLVYREIAVRFGRVPAATRDKILARYGLVVRRHNPFVKSQVIAR